MPWDVGFMSRALDGAKDLGQPREFRMNARNFADLRKFYRDELDVSTEREELKVGIVGRYRGLVVRVLRTVPAGMLLVHDGDRCLHHSVRTEFDDDLHSGIGEPEECDECLVYGIMTR